MRTIIALTTVLTLAACGGDKKDEPAAAEATSGKAAADPAANGAPAKPPAGVAVPRNEKKPPPPKRVDHGDPANVVAALFDAARNNNAYNLSRLCDPKGENDGDTREICGLTTKSEKWAEFVEYFKDGSVAGEAEIDGDSATVPIKFGPGGSKDETMSLVKRDDGWYLSGF